MVVTKSWTWFVFVLSVSAVACSVGAVAEEAVDVPQVTFQEPSIKVFNLNKQLELQFQSNIPASELRARVFWGGKDELKARAKHAPAGACAYYSSFLINYASENGEVKFGWWFKPYSLKQVSDQDFDNQVYTVVLERARGPKLEAFRLYQKDVDNYFDHGQEIVVVAPQGLKSGANSTVQEVRRIQLASSGNAQNPNPGRHPFLTPPHGPEGCIVVKTLRAAGASDPQLESPTEQLVLESCLGVGKPLPLHRPFGSISAGWALR